MPSYRYAALDEAGKKHRGRLQAAGEAELQQRLKNDGLYLEKCSVEKHRRGKKLKAQELSDFSKELGALIDAGVSLVRTLTIISEEEATKPRVRAVYAQLNKAVRRGMPLSEAMEEEQVFPFLMVYMFRAAEASGSLAKTAAMMAEHYKKENKLAAKIKSSTLYPKIIGTLLVGAVGVIMYVVMPQFAELFSLLDTMPASTKFLFWLSDMIRYKWWLLGIIAAGLVIGCKFLIKIPAVRLKVDQLKLRIPMAGKLLKVIYTARFARSFSSLYACGISVVSALQISRNTIGNKFIESQFDMLTAYVRAGNPLSEGINRVDGFSKKLSSTVKVGEESGSLEDLLLSIADTFEHDSSASIDRLVGMIEPAMIVLMAVIVAFVMFSVITPIYSSIGSMG